MSNYLSAADILGATDLKIIEVEVPEWGGVVGVRGMTGSDRDEWEAGFVTVGKDGATSMDATTAFAHMRARLLVRCLVHPETGIRLFTSKDIEKLGQKSATVLDRLYEKAQALSGISDDDIEELEKNLGSDQSDDSGSS